MCTECGALAPGYAVDEAFRFPAPYKLSGPEPSTDAADVYRLVEACIEHGHPFNMQKGLVMRAGSGGTFLNPKRHWFITFVVVDGHHKFHEASSPDMLITRLADMLAYLKSNPEPE